jgi:sterol desaturase/sphingolipid hydroxylase (fatty acid hydroxylase superfamily)
LPFDHATLYWAILITAFVSIGLWETFQPCRENAASTPRRWLLHFALRLTVNILSRFLIPATALLTAISIPADRWGLLNSASIPFPIRFTAAFLLLDLVHYCQHYIFHSVPFLWRVHQVHHADPDFDLTTGLRFHPVESLLAQGSSLAVVAAVAPPAEAVLAIELGTMVQNLFAHANVTLPGWLDSPVRKVLITPNMHRVHHSMDVLEQNTNYGTILPFWDRLFGTYRHASAAPEQTMRVGLEGMDTQSALSFFQQIALPFRRPNR